MHQLTTLMFTWFNVSRPCRFPVIFRPSLLQADSVKWALYHIVHRNSAVPIHSTFVTDFKSNIYNNLPLTEGHFRPNSSATGPSLKLTTQLNKKFPAVIQSKNASRLSEAHCLILSRAKYHTHVQSVLILYCYVSLGLLRRLSLQLCPHSQLSHAFYTVASLVWLDLTHKWDEVKYYQIKGLQYVISFTPLLIPIYMSQHSTFVPINLFIISVLP
jgi:hypothetical protein